MGPPPTYTDAQLIAAVAESRSWRDVLRRLGLRPTSGGSARSVKRHAARLGLSHVHFTGQRRWSDSQLKAAIEASTTWLEVLERLGLADGGGSLVLVRGHAGRLALEVDHLNRGKSAPRPSGMSSIEPRPELLRIAAGNFAAAWFQLRGFSVHWPQEPCRYDLVVESGGVFQRIQVKTTTRLTGGTYVAAISATRQDTSSPYDIDDVDHFFVVDAGLDAYLIPIAAVAGLQTISLRSYAGYRVVVSGALLGDVCSVVTGRTSEPVAAAATVTSRSSFGDGQRVDLDARAGDDEPRHLDQ